MQTEGIVSEENWKKAVEFHGHICPGLTIGYRAAELALARLKESRSTDEEIVAIVETNACGADAVQALTGCTFGKGNLIHHDFGKHAYTFASRSSGRGIRIALKSGAFVLTDRHRDLIERIRSGSATEAERKEFWELQGQRSKELLAKSAEDLFVVAEEHVKLPPKAMLEPSEPCESCKEPTMASKLRTTEHGRRVCGRCLLEGNIEMVHRA